MAAQDAPQYSNWLVIATIIFLAWAFMFGGVRVWAKVSRSMGWSLSDTIFTAAFTIGFAQCVCIFLAVSSGFGKVRKASQNTGPQPYEKALYAADILYVLSVGLSKCSTSLFLGSLASSKQQQRPGSAIAVCCACWTIGSVFAIALRGDLTSPWSLPRGTHTMYNRWLGVEVSGLGLEAVIWAFSTTLVMGLNMSIVMRLKVLGIFAFRFLLVPVVAGRLFFLSPSNVDARSMHAITISYILTEAAMQYSLMSECMTCLKPFLQPFHSGYGVSQTYSTDIRMNPSRDPYTELSNVSHAQDGVVKTDAKVSLREVLNSTEGKKESRALSRRSSPRRVLRRDDMDGRLRFRADVPGSAFTSYVEADNAGNGRRNPDEDDVELLQRHDMGITQTTTVSVVEER